MREVCLPFPSGSCALFQGERNPEGRGHLLCLRFQEKTAWRGHTTPPFQRKPEVTAKSEQWLQFIYPSSTALTFVSTRLKSLLEWGQAGVSRLSWDA